MLKFFENWLAKLDLPTDLSCNKSLGGQTIEELLNPYQILVFLNGPSSASFSFYFRLFKQTLQFLQKINVKNVHPVYGAGNQTHGLWNLSLFP